MKKTLCTSLSLAMALSLAPVTFAAVDNHVAEISTEGHLEKEGVVQSDVVSENVPFGKTIYYPLIGEDSTYVSEYDAVKSVSMKKKWDMNGDAVEDVSIVKKKYEGDASGNANDYYYFLAIKLKNSSTTSRVDISGTVTLKKSGSDGFVTPSGDDSVTLDVGVTAGFDYASSTDLDDTQKIFYFTDSDVDNAIATTDEETINLYGNAGYLTISTVGQGKILLSNDLDYDADIASKYAYANLDFVNGNGASFNKIGEMTLYADEGSYLYEVKPDGTLAEIEDAEYDEYEEAFKFKTRTLGRYVISDAELDLTGSDDSEEEVDVPVIEDDATGGNFNPSTGASA